MYHEDSLNTHDMYYEDTFCSHDIYYEYISGERFNLRWFTPTNEMALCGHATLASAAVLMFSCGNMCIPV